MSLPSSSLWKNLNNSLLLRYLLLFGCGWATIVLINYFYSTIALFSAAGIFAVLLNYPVDWLSRHMARGWAITLSFLGAIVLVLGLVTFVGLTLLNQGQGLLTELTNGLNQQDLLPFQDFLNQLEISRVIGTLQTGLASGLNLVQGIFSSVFTGIFGAVISLYMLIDGDKLWRAFLQFLPLSFRNRFAQTFRQSFLGFIRGQLMLMLFLGGSTLLLFTLLGIDYALILAVTVGLLDAIPGIGAVLGIVVVVVLVFTAQGAGVALKALIISIILEQIQENYVRPKVVGDTLELNPVLLFLSLFIGQRVAGLLGVFLAIPIAGMIAAWMRSVQADHSTSDTATEGLVQEVEKS